MEQACETQVGGWACFGFGGGGEEEAEKLKKG
jgi:hypothetical protein